MNQFETRVAPEGARLAYLSRQPAAAPPAEQPAQPLAIFEMCKGAGRLNLLPGLIVERATMSAVKARLAAERAPAPAPTEPAPAEAGHATSAAARAAAHAGAAQDGFAAIDAREILARHRGVMAARAAARP